MSSSRERRLLGAFRLALALLMSACAPAGPRADPAPSTPATRGEGLALIDWNKPRPMAERLTNQGEVQELPEKYVGKIKALADGRDMSGRMAMLSGYVLPEGWQDATRGVNSLVATNGGGLFHDPATVLAGILFEEMTGIKIEWRPMACEDLPPKHITTFASRSGAIDLAYSCSAFLDVPLWAGSGWIEPADFLWPPEVQKLYVTGLPDTFKGPDGRFYGAPGCCLHTWYLYYRPSWLEGAGVAVPGTWQELVTASRKVDEWAKRNVGPQAAGLSIATLEPTVVVHLWGHPTYARGESIMRDGRAVIDPEVWQLLVDLWQQGGMTRAAFEHGWADTPEAFAKGNLGFAVTYETYLDLFSDPQFAGAVQGDWKMAPLPAWEGVGETGHGQLRIDAWLVNAFSSPQKKAAAMLFADFYRSYQGAFNELVFEGNDAIMTQVTQHPQATRSSILPQQYLSIRQEALQRQRLETFPPAMTEALKVYKEFLSKAVLEGMDPAQAREQAQQSLDNILGTR